MRLAQPPGELDAAHARHDHVGDDHHDLCECTVNRSSACWPSVASSVSIAGLAEHGRRQAAQRAFVFGDQDRAAAALGLRRSCFGVGVRIGRVVGARQQQRERGALARSRCPPRSRRRSGCTKP